MSIRGQRRRGASAVLGAAFLTSIFTAGFWTAQSVPAMACLTTPCNSQTDYTNEYLAEYEQEKKDMEASNGGPGWQSTMSSNQGPGWVLTPLFQGTGASGGGYNGISGGPGHLGMYVSSPSSGIDGWGGFGGASEVRSGGYGLTDTAGAVATGTKSPGFTDVSGGGGLFGTYDVSRYVGLPADQSLVLSGYFNYGGDSLSVASAPGLAPLIVGNAGSLTSDTYTFGGNVQYRFGSSYVVGSGSYNFGTSHETDNVAGSTGGLNSSGYNVDGRIGHVFVLANSTGVPIGTAAPGKPAPGTIFGLDASAHVGYSANESDNFTDSAGFMYGKGEVQNGDFGARARFFAGTADSGLVWVPYVSVTLDDEFDMKNTFTIPNQAALPGGDILNFQVERLFLGADAGLDVHGPNGWVVGAKAFIDGSTDTSMVGGVAYVKIPFNYMPTVAARY